MNRPAHGSNLLIVALCSIFVLVSLFYCAGLLSKTGASPLAKTDVRIYCAAGIANTIQSIVDRFNEHHEFQVRIERIGGSGELAGQIKSEFEIGLSVHADIFISNDEDLLRSPELATHLVGAFSLASQTPVIAVSANREFDFKNLEALLGSSSNFGVASKNAAIGKLTRSFAERLDRLEDLENEKTLDAENVMVLAQALMIGSLDAAIIWDTTVMQINEALGLSALTISGTLESPEQIKSSTAVAILKPLSNDPNENSSRLNRARKFTSFLRGENSKKELEEAGYEFTGIDLSLNSALTMEKANHE